MKNIILFLVLIAFVSCKENERLTYDANRHDVYFRDIRNDDNKKNDSLFVSLLKKETNSVTKVPVQVLGSVLTAPKKFRVEVIPERTTAVEGVHYKKLPDYYEFPADTIVYDMPVEIIKGDESLTDRSVVLALRLVASDEMGIAYEEKGFIRLVIAEMLKVPTEEDAYDDMPIFRKLFGPYSRTKHLMIIDLVGHDFWDGDYGAYGGLYGLYNEQGYYTPYARQLYKIITSGVYLDENGQQMVGWNVP